MKTLFFCSSPLDARLIRQTVADSQDIRVVEVPITPESALLAEGCSRVFCLDQGILPQEIFEIWAQMGVREVGLGAALHLPEDIPGLSVGSGGLIIRQIPISTPQSEANWIVHRALALLSQGSEGPRILNGRTVGLLGLGRTGKVLGQILHGFGCRMLAWDQHPDRTFATRYGIDFADLDILLDRCDVLAVQLPYSAETRHLLSRERLARCPKQTLLLNVSHPEILVLEQVEKLLREGALSGYAQEMHSCFQPAAEAKAALQGIEQLPQTYLGPDSCADTLDARQNRLRLALRLLDKPVFQG